MPAELIFPVVLSCFASSAKHREDPTSRLSHLIRQNHCYCDGGYSLVGRVASWDRGSDQGECRKVGSERQAVMSRAGVGLASDHNESDSSGSKETHLLLPEVTQGKCGCLEHPTFTRQSQ